MRFDAFYPGWVYAATEAKVAWCKDTKLAI